MPPYFSSLASFLHSPSSRRRSTNTWAVSSDSALESFETRNLLATSVYGTWSLSILPPGVPPAEDPGPYILVLNQGGTNIRHGKIHAQGSDFGTIQLPGEGGVALSKIKVSKDGQSVKAKIKSDPFKGSLEAQLAENQNEINATLKFLDKSTRLSEDFKLKGPQAP